MREGYAEVDPVPQTDRGAPRRPRAGIQLRTAELNGLIAAGIKVEGVVPAGDRPPDKTSGATDSPEMVGVGDHNLAAIRGGRIVLPAVGAPAMPPKRRDRLGGTREQHVVV